jgi:predicted CoA-binding protein
LRRKLTSALERVLAMPDYSDEQIKRVLGSVKTIAVVGVSANEARPSYFVMKYMQAKGYRCIPVNPGLAGQTLLGEKVYPDLKSIPDKIDMVDIFRNSEAAGPVTDEAIAIGAKAVWMQLGVINEAAAKRAEAAGLAVIMDRCPKMEYSRFSGEFGWVGRNSRIIDNRRKHLGQGRAALARDAIGRGKGTL